MKYIRTCIDERGEGEKRGRGKRARGGRFVGKHVLPRPSWECAHLHRSKGHLCSSVTYDVYDTSDDDEDDD
jgi:hypothetical protein